MPGKPPKNGGSRLIAFKLFLFSDVFRGTVLLIASVAVSVVFIFFSSQRDFTSLESTFFQIFVTAFAISGSFLLSKKSMDEKMKNFAVLSFRKSSFLFHSLGRLNQSIDNELKNNKDSISLTKLQASAIEQLYASAAILEDWKDIIPEEVEELERRLETLRKTFNKEGYLK